MFRFTTRDAADHAESMGVARIGCTAPELSIELSMIWRLYASANTLWYDGSGANDVPERAARQGVAPGHATGAHRLARGSADRSAGHQPQQPHRRVQQQARRRDQHGC